MCLCSLLTIWTENHEICMLKSKLQVLHKPSMLYCNPNTRCLCFCCLRCHESSGEVIYELNYQISPMTDFQMQSVYHDKHQSEVRYVGTLCVVCVEQMVFETKCLGGEHDEPVQIRNQTRVTQQKTHMQGNDK